MDVTQVKSQVSEALKAKNMGATAGMVRAGSFGPDKPTSGFNPLALGAGVCLLVGIVAWMGGRSIQANQVSPASTNHAQVDLAMQMLANQQEINDRLLQGQQDLSKTIIENAKPNHTTVLCIGSRMCPGNAPSDGGVMVQPSDQPYESVQAQPPISQPVQTIAATDDAERFYRQLSEELIYRPERFYRAALAWRNHVEGNSNEPMAIALRRIYQEMPNAKPY